MLSRIYSFLFSRKQPQINPTVRKQYVGTLESNGQYSSDWLPGAEVKAVIKYHVWGIARKGCESEGESDFIDGGPQVAVTEVMVDLFGSFIPLDLCKVDSATRGRIEAHVLEMVGEEKLSQLLWDQVESTRNVVSGN